ncbi:maltodextrin glucosidase [Dongshaea marina]|uniref:maltodextrin glucosidase n=1 Tax=Dongshaea marina TaxID=2047966 RepID=UPI001F3CF37A|nr:maltodextrin glucosidase [Dongshaea marina]
MSALYINPIFCSPSNHKYDTVDYYQVDPLLGGNAQLESLSKSIHGRGMKLILDAVVNHTSDEHPWFNHFGEEGAFGNPDSPYRDFYSFDSNNNYVAWKGMQHLPKLNYANEELCDVIYRGDKAVLRHWLRPPFSIDGWRLDVIHMLGEKGSAENNAHHVKEIRQSVKQEKPDAYLLGEHFFEATPWLQGEQEDGAMNYFGFAHPLRAFFTGKDLNGDPIELDAGKLSTWLLEARNRIPFANQLAQFNLLDSHDTARFFTLLGEDLALMKAAVSMLFTYIGVPCIYYGDEVGMTGGEDPDCRRCFPWASSDWNHLLHEHYRRMSRLRRIHPALRRGDLLTLYAGHHSYVYARVLESDQVITAINRHATKARTMILPLWHCLRPFDRFTDVESGEKFEVVNGELQLTIPARSSLVLVAS